MEVKINLDKWDLNVLNQSECDWISTRQRLDDGTEIEIRITKVKVKP